MSLHNYEVEILESLARTANVNSADQQNTRHCGVAILLNVSAVGGTPGQIIAVDIQAKIGAGYLSVARYGLLGRDYSVTGPKEIHLSDHTGGHTDITAPMLNLTAGVQAICKTSADHVHVGLLHKFNRIVVDLDTLASADGGIAVVKYWNGTADANVAGLVDGTAVGGNTLRQDGVITFTMPTDWYKNDEPAAGTNLYYITLATTANTGTDAVAQSIEPSRAIRATGQFGFLLHPSVPPPSNAGAGWTSPIIQGALPRNWRLVLTHADQSNSITYDVRASYLV